MLTCECKTAETARDQALSDLHDGMIQNDTISTVATTFYEYAASKGKRNMQECVPIYDHSYSEDLYNMIVMSALMQNGLGWKLSIKGKLIKLWAFIQEEYY